MPVREGRKEDSSFLPLLGIRRYERREQVLQAGGRQDMRVATDPQTATLDNKTIIKERGNSIPEKLATSLHWWATNYRTKRIFEKNRQKRKKLVEVEHERVERAPQEAASASSRDMKSEKEDGLSSTRRLFTWGWPFGKRFIVYSEFCYEDADLRKFHPKRCKMIYAYF